MQYSVFYPTDISSLPDHRNDNLDVCVALENGMAYTLVFITPANLEAMMKRDGTSYVDPRFKCIVVERLEENIIENAIREIVSDERLLCEYGL